MKLWSRADHPTSELLSWARLGKSFGRCDDRLLGAVSKASKVLNVGNIEEQRALVYQ